jgi:hypothetical protein
VRPDPQRSLAASVLVFESLVVLFAGLAVRGLAARSDGAGSATSDGTTELVVCAGLAVTCLLVAGMLRSRAGYVLGSALQVAVLATGFWVTEMFLLGAVFGALWVAALRIGARIRRERAAAENPSSGM